MDFGHLVFWVMDIGRWFFLSNYLPKSTSLVRIISNVQRPTSNLSFTQTHAAKFREFHQPFPLRVRCGELVLLCLR